MAKQNKTSLFQLERNMSRAQQRPAERHRNAKSGLLSMEQGLCRHNGNTHRIDTQGYDTGQAISLQTSQGYFPIFPEQMSAMHPRHPFTDAFTGGGAYLVESYEEPALAESPSNEIAETVFDRPEVRPPALTSNPQLEPELAQITPDKLGQEPASPVTAPPAEIVQPDITTAPPLKTEDKDDFEEDIKKLLEEHAKQPQKQPPPEPILTKSYIEEPAPAKTPQADTSNSHAIFDKIALNMGNATIYDLGHVDLSNRLNKIEHSLDVDEQREQQKTLPASFADVAALGDQDIMNDLSVVSSLLESRLKEDPIQKIETAVAQLVSNKVSAAPDLSSQAIDPAAGKPTTIKPAPAPAEPDTPTSPDTATPTVEATPTATQPDAVPPNEIPAAEPTSAPGAAADAFDVKYTVPTAQATDRVSVQATGAAMLVAWQDQNTIDMQALIAGTGTWAAYAPALRSTGPEFFATWDLETLDPAPLVLEQLHTLLKQNGPLWLQNPAVETTVRIVTGMSGDGTRNSTTITIIDPAADAQSTQQTTNIDSLIKQLGSGPVRVAYLAK